jgi:arsenite methyltransferase
MGSQTARGKGANESRGWERMRGETHCRETRDERRGQNERRGIPDPSLSKERETDVRSVVCGSADPAGGSGTPRRAFPTGAGGAGREGSRGGACCESSWGVACGGAACGAGVGGLEMSQRIVEAVRSTYGSVARSGLSSEQEGVRAVAEAFGYSPEELATIPAEANMALSCGNPTAFASLKPGETVVDLGCGGGLDVFLAAAKVGPTGKAIGIDMTPDMLELARRNAAKAGVTNVEFHEARIDALPLADGSVDCVISNCVINLAPDKDAVFREIARVLKPGGRLAVSDIALKRALPPEIATDLTALVGCIAGAISIEEYRAKLRAAGFAHVEVIDSGSDLNAYAQVRGACCAPVPSEEAACCTPGDETGCCATEEENASCCLPVASAPAADGCCAPEAGFHEGLAGALSRVDVNAFAASVRVYGVRG